MSLINRKLNPQTGYDVPHSGAPSIMYLSSSIVKELAHYDVALSGFSAGGDHPGVQSAAPIQSKSKEEVKQ